MSFLKRAVLYCFRQRLKTAILFLVLTLIAAFLLTSLAIRDGVRKSTAQVQTAIGGKIELNLDTEGHMGGGEQNQWGTAYYYTGDLITQDIVDAIKKVDGVVDYNSEGTGSYYGAGVDFKYLPAAFDLSYTPYGESSSYTATLSSEKCAHFQRGEYKLVDGRHIQPEDSHTCLISKELADYNHLSVGDQIQMYSLDAEDITSFEIVGIFDGTKGTEGNALTVDEIPANCGYIDYATLFELFQDKIDGYDQLTIFVEDPVNIQNVYDRIAALPELKDKTLKLDINTETYDVVSSPLESLEKLIHTTILFISLVGVAVLTLLLTIWIRGRKREIGILLSIGKNKANILFQIFTETLAVTILSFTSSIPLSYLTAEKAGTFFLSKAAAANAGFHVEVQASYLAPFYLIGILLIAISVLASSWTVVCQKPNDILMKMD